MSQSSTLSRVETTTENAVESRVQRFLEIYPCGPESHSPASAAVSSCPGCDKLVGTEICIFCGHFGRFDGGVVPQSFLRHADGRETAGALCASCYLDLRDHPELDWHLARG